MGDIYVVSGMSLNASQTTETEVTEDIRTNEQYNLRPNPGQQVSKTTIY